MLRLRLAPTSVGSIEFCSPSIGKLCQWTDACLSHPCANGSTYTTVANQFSCKCLTGFTGQKCETDVNECDIPGQCQHGGTCLNLPGSYQCQCPQGFTGQHCNSPYLPVHPPPVSMVAPAGRLVTSRLNATAFQVRRTPSVLGLGENTFSAEGRWWEWLSCSFRKYPSEQEEGEVRILCGVGCW